MRLLFALLLVLAVASQPDAADRPFVRPPRPAPGQVEPCNVLESCLPYSRREQFSLGFLCCEQTSGWVAAHILNPLGVGIFFDSFSIALAVAFWFEAFEISALTFLGTFVFFESREIDLETFSGAVIGDAFIQGTIGALLGFLLRWAFEIEGPLRKWSRMTGWLRFKYLVFWLLYSLSFLLLGYGSDGFSFGLLIALGVHAVLLLLLFPLATQSRADEDIVWRVTTLQGRKTRKETRNGPAVDFIRLQRTYVPRSRRWAFFVAWFLVNATIALQAVGPGLYLANYWYQTWVGSAIAILALVVVGVVRRQRKGKDSRFTE